MSSNRRHFVSKGLFTIGALAMAGAAKAEQTPEAEVADFVGSYGRNVRVSGSVEKGISIVAEVKDIGRMRHELSGRKFDKVMVAGNSVSFSHRGIRFSLDHSVGSATRLG